MNISLHGRAPAWIFGAGLALVSTAGQAQIVNGDFESGLAGWTTLGDASVQGPTQSPPGLSSNLLWLTSASVNDQDDYPLVAGALNRSGIAAAEAASAGGLASFVGLSVTGLDPLGAEAYEGSAARRSFTAAAGSVLSFDWNFGTRENGAQAQPDYGFVVLDGQLTVLAGPANATSIGDLLGNLTRTGVSSYSFTLGSSGVHSIAFGVVDVGDYSVTSTLAVDNVVLSAVPEAPAWLSMLAGLSLIGVAARRRG